MIFLFAGHGGGDPGAVGLAGRAESVVSIHSRAWRLTPSLKSLTI